MTPQPGADEPNNAIAVPGNQEIGGAARNELTPPLLTREDWLSTESEGLLNRLFGGRVAPLVAHFSKQRKLSKRDLADLKRLLQELD